MWKLNQKGDASDITCLSALVMLANTGWSTYPLTHLSRQTRVTTIAAFQSRRHQSKGSQGESFKSINCDCYISTEATTGGQVVWTRRKHRGHDSIDHALMLNFKASLWAFPPFAAIVARHWDTVKLLPPICLPYCQHTVIEEHTMTRRWIQYMSHNSSILHAPLEMALYGTWSTFTTHCTLQK